MARCTAAADGEYILGRTGGATEAIKFLSDNISGRYPADKRATKLESANEGFGATARLRSK